MGVYPQPSAVLLLSDPHPSNPHPVPLLCYLAKIFSIPSFSFSSFSAVCHLPTIFFFFFLHFPSSLAPSLIDQLYLTPPPPPPPPSPTTFPSHQIPVFAGMGRRGIKLEISGANADWNGTFPLLQPSSRTFLRSGWDTAGVAKEGGL